MHKWTKNLTKAVNGKISLSPNGKRSQDVKFGPIPSDPLENERLMVENLYETFVSLQHAMNWWVKVLSELRGFDYQVAQVVAQMAIWRGAGEGVESVFEGEREGGVDGDSCGGIVGSGRALRNNRKRELAEERTEMQVHAENCAWQAREALKEIRTVTDAMSGILAELSGARSIFRERRDLFDSTVSARLKAKANPATAAKYEQRAQAAIARFQSIDDVMREELPELVRQAEPLRDDAFRLLQRAQRDFFVRSKPNQIYQENQQKFPFFESESLDATRDPESRLWEGDIATDASTSTSSPGTSTSASDHTSIKALRAPNGVIARRRKAAGEASTSPAATSTPAVTSALAAGGGMNLDLRCKKDVLKDDHSSDDGYDDPAAERRGTEGREKVERTESGTQLFLLTARQKAAGDSSQCDSPGSTGVSSSYEALTALARADRTSKLSPRSLTPRTPRSPLGSHNHAHRSKSPSDTPQTPLQTPPHSQPHIAVMAYPSPSLGPMSVASPRDTDSDHVGARESARSGREKPSVSSYLIRSSSYSEALGRSPDYHRSGTAVAPAVAPTNGDRDTHSHTHSHTHTHSNTQTQPRHSNSHNNTHNSTHDLPARTMSDTSASKEPVRSLPEPFTSAPFDQHSLPAGALSQGAVSPHSGNSGPSMGSDSSPLHVPEASHLEDRESGTGVASARLHTEIESDDDVADDGFYLDDTSTETGREVNEASGSRTTPADRRMPEHMQLRLSQSTLAEEAFAQFKRSSPSPAAASPLLSARKKASPTSE